MEPLRRELFGMPLDTGLGPAEVVDRITRQPVLLSYLNPFAWSVAGKFTDYRENLEAMDLVVCDGIMVRKATRRVHGIDAEIVSLDYSGIARDYLQLWGRQGSRICLVGARPEVLAAASGRLRKDFPGINISAEFSGFGDGPQMARDYILEANPEFVLAGMGMGLQERFLVGLRNQGWNGSGVCIGAFLDRLAEPRHDYPEWSKKYNVRFLGNLSRRPAYYLRRYGVDYLPFLKQYVQHVLRRPGGKG